MIKKASQLSCRIQNWLPLVNAELVKSTSRKNSVIEMANEYTIKVLNKTYAVKRSRRSATGMTYHSIASRVMDKFHVIADTL